MDSILKALAGVSAFLAGLFALFIYGKKQGKDEVTHSFELKQKEDELINEFKKTEIHNEVANSDLDDLIASDNARHSKSK